VAHGDDSVTESMVKREDLSRFAPERTAPQPPAALTATAYGHPSRGRGCRPLERSWRGKAPGLPAQVRPGHCLPAKGGARFRDPRARAAPGGPFGPFWLQTLAHTPGLCVAHSQYSER